MKNTNAREDVSQFVIHLTRDDRKTFPNGGETARKNFLSILKSKRILAPRAHFLFGDKIKNLEEKELEKFKVCCFTETPLNQIHRLVGSIPGRQIAMDAYGIVFNKDFMIKSGGQPAIYINSYNYNTWLREGIDELFNQSIIGGKVQSKIWRILPFLNAMHEKYDFTWEREWRVRGELKFNKSDIVCVILPELGDYDIKERLAKIGIAAISPGWNYEQIVTQLASQQRRTKSLASITDNEQATADKS